MAFQAARRIMSLIEEGHDVSSSCWASGDRMHVPGGPAAERSIRADERQRIARDVHDSTSQLLVVLQLQLGRLKRSAPECAGSMVREIEATIQDIRGRIRSLELTKD
jgi:signal transduction histidine kinase